MLYGLVRLEHWPRLFSMCLRAPVKRIGYLDVEISDQMVGLCGQWPWHLETALLAFSPSFLHPRAKIDLCRDPPHNSVKLVAVLISHKEHADQLLSHVCNWKCLFMLGLRGLACITVLHTPLAPNCQPIMETFAGALPHLPQSV